VPSPGLRPRVRCLGLRAALPEHQFNKDFDMSTTRTARAARTPAKAASTARKARPVARARQPVVSPLRAAGAQTVSKAAVALRQVISRRVETLAGVATQRFNGARAAFQRVASSSEVQSLGKTVRDAAQAAVARVTTLAQQRVAAVRVPVPAKTRAKAPAKTAAKTTAKTAGKALVKAASKNVRTASRV
jgi:hypothetical protein